ncbi:MAG: HAD family hydrolase [Pseudomonadota bacterium]|nr:HAD family hydrolase [Pseudomonadota bacterium]
MPVTLLSFDLDHTLWDPTASLINAEQAMLDWIATHSPVTADFYPADKLREYQQWVAQSYPELRGKVSELRFQTLRRVFLQSGHDSEQAVELARGAFGAFFTARSQGLELFENVAEVMAELAQRYTLIAISNGNADLSLAGHEHLFSAHYKADDFEAPKPAPDMFISALKAHNVTADQVIHIGDHPQQDIQAAAELGIKTCWFNDKQAEWPLDTCQPHAEFSHWSQLAQCLASLDDPAQSGS